MKRMIGALLSLTLGVAAVLPACAADRETPLESTVLLPVRVAALGAGIVVGTPVAIVRNAMDTFPKARGIIADQFNAGTADSVAADSILFDLAAMPPSLTTGVVLGLYQGTDNALKNCMDSPFSPESFSLGDNKDRR
jgi:hypothetical protein